MKKIFSLCVCSLLLCGCSDSFLDQQPEDTLSPAVFYKTPNDIKAGLVSVYEPLQTLFSVWNVPHILGQMSDDFSAE